MSPIAKGLPSAVEVLRKQLTLSETTIKDLREEVRSLQNTVERISVENRELKIMMQVIYFDPLNPFNCRTKHSETEINIFPQIIFKFKKTSNMRFLKKVIASSKITLIY